jgi:hypothetical protein
MIHLKYFHKFNTINEATKVDKVDPVSYDNETVLSLPYTDLIEENRQSFLKKLVRISKDLAINPLWLLHTIFHESEFDPKKSDRISGAVGLISFLPEVIKNFIDEETGKSYTPNDILEMTNTEQLDIVKAFYSHWMERSKIKRPVSAGDFASLTFYPETINKDWEWEFPEFIVEKNPGLFKSFPSDGAKTKKEYYSYIDQMLNSEDAYDEDNSKFLGNFTGAILNPRSYEAKKPLEVYIDLIGSMEDPILNQELQAQSREDVKKNQII